MVDELHGKARLLYEAAEQLGWTDPKKIAARAQSLERGLPAEDELCAVFHWLGRCRLAHKLDQAGYPPGSTERYRVPDLLVVFDVNGDDVPVLIEVKASNERNLDWSPKFMAAHQRYAALLGLPLLVAWKYHSFWVLFDAAHMQPSPTNHKIKWIDAIKENLLGVLAGDFSFSFREGVGFHMSIKKEGPLEEGNGFRGVIDDAYIADPEGNRHNGGGGIFQLFLCLDQEATVMETETHAVQSFIISSSEAAEFAHRAMVKLLSTFSASGPNQTVLWRQILARNLLPRIGDGPHQAAQNALEARLLRHVIQQLPRTMPPFLVKRGLKAAANTATEPN